MCSCSGRPAPGGRAFGFQMVDTPFQVKALCLVVVSQDELSATALVPGLLACCHVPAIVAMNSTI